MGAASHRIGSVSSRGVEGRLHDTADQLEAAARELRAIASQPIRLGKAVRSIDEIRENADMLAALAEREYEKRRLRENLIPTAQFSDPAWDILLDMFIFEMKGQRSRISSVAIASHSPPTTALRYIGILQDEGMIVREQSEEDGRVVNIRLTDEALLGVGSYFLNCMGG